MASFENTCAKSVYSDRRDFGFCLLRGNSKFGHYCEFSDEEGVLKETFAIALKDSVDLAIVQRVLEVLVLCVMV